MKKIVLTLGTVLASLSIYAQGTVSMNTFGGGVNAPARRASDNSALGTAFKAQLFFGPAGAPEGSLIALTQLQGGIATLNAGYVTTALGGGVKALPAIAEGTHATVQLRAWEAVLGPDFATAQAAWMAMAPGPILGRSAFIDVVTGAPTGNPPTAAALLIGLNPPNTFLLSVNPVPEPSVIALGFLGLGSLLLLRRRK